MMTWRPRRTGHHAERLRTLPNIGQVLAGDLHEVGVPDVETLRQIGADEAANRLAEAGRRDCTHATRALRGALDAMPERGRPAPSAEVDDMSFREH
jgi:hypothetical protein